MRDCRSSAAPAIPLRSSGTSTWMARPAAMRTSSSAARSASAARGWACSAATAEPITATKATPTHALRTRKHSVIARNARKSQGLTYP